MGAEAYTWVTKYKKNLGEGGQGGLTCGSH
ncbi:MAG: hypothetical protein BWY31_03382 [Lentisphaerae bacterium ADurb.Bin242]|nr:MAG: hypothetical protein BWY31_03382 [Lentisphaerae bacterium ADurb.Bin242]